jgi:hypothetical protein
MAGEAFRIGVELLAAVEALRRHGRRSGYADGLDRVPFPEAAIEALDELDHLEPLFGGHVLEARHDAVATQADRHRAAATAHAFRHGPEQIRGRRELTRRRRTELEFRPGEISRLR